MTETVSVVGLGYVGLPLAVAFSRKFKTIGYDIDPERVAQCESGTDVTGEVSPEILDQASDLQFTNDIAECTGTFIVVAVPTPVDGARLPDLAPLIGACETIGPVLRRGQIVVFESTVYPGATEEVCIPALERESGLVHGSDFHVAYSPERVNPGDQERTLQKIVKLVAADDPQVLRRVSDLYAEIVDAGVYEVSSIKVAEAAKVIENTQRDLNIALVNELAIIFDVMGLDTTQVLQAAGTKWNFLPFKPGLVGGHCIGVDPYYLTYKAQALGYHPEVILAGRRINDSMGEFVVDRLLRRMLEAKINICDSTVAIMGLTFKEDCPDLRNSKVTGIVAELRNLGVRTKIHDPAAPPALVQREFGQDLSDWDSIQEVDALIVAVGHKLYRQKTEAEFVDKLKPPGVIIDVKSIFDPDSMEAQGVHYWRL